MTAFEIIGAAILAVLIVGTFIVADHIDEVLNGIGEWAADDEKAADVAARGDEQVSQRPSETSSQTKQLN